MGFSHASHVSMINRYLYDGWYDEWWELVTCKERSATLPLSLLVDLFALFDFYI